MDGWVDIRAGIRTRLLRLLLFFRGRSVAREESQSKHRFHVLKEVSVPFPPREIKEAFEENGARTRLAARRMVWALKSRFQSRVSSMPRSLDGLLMNLSVGTITHTMSEI
jgi:hypothetical protein